MNGQNLQPNYEGLPNMEEIQTRHPLKWRYQHHTLPFIQTLCGISGSDLSDTKLMWQTFDDAGIIKLLTRMAYGSPKELYLNLEELNLDSAGIFAAVNGTSPDGRKKRDIQTIRCVWADLDEKNATEPFDFSVLPLQPTMVVRSGHGTHLYWCFITALIANPETNQCVETLMRAIQKTLQTFGADKQVCDISRVMRIPGFYNMKRGPYPLVELLSNDGPRYAIEEIEAAFPQVNEEKDSRRIPPRGDSGVNRGGQAVDSDRGVTLQKAAEYLAECDPAISGDAGHATTFNTALKVISGFDLTIHEAIELMDEYNQTCLPPWTDEEMLHKIEDAHRVAQESNHRGWMMRRLQRPIIKVSAEHQVVKDSVSAIAPHGDVYSRKGILYRIVTSGSIHPVIEPANPYWLRERLSERAFFCCENKDGEIRPLKVPEWLAPMVLARKEWPGIDELRALVEAPVYLGDGKILSEPGFDEVSALYLEMPRSHYPEIKANPSKEDAEAKVQELYKVVADFPFASMPSPECHRAAWLAFVMTLVARFAIDGPVPFGLFDASTAGSGKGLLMKISSLIALGHAVPTMPSVSEEEELRKRILLPLVSGDRIAWIDDVESPFGGCVWNGLMTSYPEYRDRILGKSEALTVPVTTVWGVTGNNISLKGDSTRRALHIRLEPQVENPEERYDFAIPDLVGHVEAKHPELLSAVLTILKAYHSAGTPSSGLAPLGSFEAWSRVVRDCVYWITGEDVCQTQRTLGSTSDENRNCSQTLLAGIHRIWKNEVFTSQDLFEKLQESVPSEQVLRLKNAADQLKRGIPELTVRSLGHILSRIRGQVHGHFQLQVVLNRRQGNGYRINHLEKDEVVEVVEDVLGSVGGNTVDNIHELSTEEFIDQLRASGYEPEVLQKG